MCSATAALRSTRGTSRLCAHSVIAAAVAGAAVVRLAVGFGDVHRRQRRHDRDAGAVEIDCATGLFKVLGAQVRRQRRPGHRREPGLHPAVAVADPAAQPRRPYIADELPQGGGQHRRQRIHPAGREDHGARPGQRRPGPRVLGRRPPDVPAGPADAADQFQIPIQLRRQRYWARFGDRRRAAPRWARNRPASRRRPAVWAAIQRTSPETCAEAFHTSRRQRMPSRSSGRSSCGVAGQLHPTGVAHAAQDRPVGDRKSQQRSR